MQLGGKLDAADQPDTGLGGVRHGLIVTLEGIVIGNAEHVNTAARRFRDQLCGRTSAVGFVSVRM